MRYFVAVAEEEHVGRAAERLNVSQSPLSRQIRQLEAQLGVELFVREGRGVRLTALGRDALERARQLLHRADALRDYLGSAGRGDAGPVDIGYIHGASYNGSLPRALARLRASFPLIEPRLHPLSSRQQLAALRALRINLGFSHGTTADPEIENRLLAKEGFVVALPVRKDLPGELGAEELADLSWITLPRGTHPAFHEQFRTATHALGFTPRIAVETVDVPAALGFVAAGLGAALVQESISQLLPDGVMTRPAPALGMEIRTYAIWRSATVSPITRHLLGCLDDGTPV
ncbi:MAG: LysR substrate-binding domain-containing protein [Devosia sp.]